MVYLLTALVASMIVFAQVLWKLGVESVTYRLDIATLFSRGVFELIFSPFIVVGVIIYGVAAILYMLLLGRYDYSIVQSLVIPLTLIVSYVIASLVFKEKISLINIAGILTIIIGVFLAVKR